MGRTIVLIWGGAILFFILVSQKGAPTAINSVANLATGVTKTLQGR